MVAAEQRVVWVLKVSRGQEKPALPGCLDVVDATSGMREVEQCRDQLPRAPKVGALGNASTRVVYGQSSCRANRHAQNATQSGRN
jgi:hypothetical protein